MGGSSARASPHRRASRVGAQTPDRDKRGKTRVPKSGVRGEISRRRNRAPPPQTARLRAQVRHDVVTPKPPATPRSRRLSGRPPPGRGDGTGGRPTLSRLASPPPSHSPPLSLYVISPFSLGPPAAGGPLGGIPAPPDSRRPRQQEQEPHGTAAEHPEQPGENTQPPRPAERRLVRPPGGRRAAHPCPCLLPPHPTGRPFPASQNWGVVRGTPLGNGGEFKPITPGRSLDITLSRFGSAPLPRDEARTAQKGVQRFMATSAVSGL